MATKTFKIGECAKGGIITVVVTKQKTTIIAKEWDYSQGSNRGSNQSNAKEWDRKEVLNNSPRRYWDLNLYLNDLTTSYYADKIIEWCDSRL